MAALAHVVDRVCAHKRDHPATDRVPRLQQPELALAARERVRLHLEVRDGRVAIPGVEVVAASALGVDDALSEAVVLGRVLLHVAAYRESLAATCGAELVGFSDPARLRVAKTAL